MKFEQAFALNKPGLSCTIVVLMAIIRAFGKDLIKLLKQCDSIYVGSPNVNKAIASESICLSQVVGAALTPSSHLDILERANG